MRTSKYFSDSSRLRSALANSANVRQAIEFLGASVSQAVYERFYRACDEQGIDVVFGREWVHPNYVPDEMVLIADSPYVNNRLDIKARILANGRENQCEWCGLGSEWQGRPLSLQLDHINGVSNDHRPENLRILCPNCHTQTPTFAGRRRQ